MAHLSLPAPLVGDRACGFPCACRSGGKLAVISADYRDSELLRLNSQGKWLVRKLFEPLPGIVVR